MPNCHRLTALTANLPASCLELELSDGPIVGSGSGSWRSNDTQAGGIDELWEDAIAAAGSYSSLLFVSCLVAAGKAIGKGSGKVHGRRGRNPPDAGDGDGEGDGSPWVDSDELVITLLGTIFAISFLMAYVPDLICSLPWSAAEQGRARQVRRHQ